MRLLLDTRVFLWWLTDDPGLDAARRDAIADPDALVHVSAATIWQISLEESRGRIDTGGGIVEEIEAGGFVELPITARHAVAAGRLPRIHADPFNRLLVAQAREEKLTLVTQDPILAEYRVDLL